MIKESLINQQLKATYLEASIYSKLRDLSYKALNGTRQPMRGLSDNIVDMGRMPFNNQPTDEITEERIIDYKKKLEGPARIDQATGEAFKYIDVPDIALIPDPLINGPGLTRPAVEKDITDTDLMIDNIVKVVIPLLQTQIQKTEVDLDVKKAELKRLKNPGKRAAKQAEIDKLDLEIKGYENDINVEKKNITDLEVLKPLYRNNINENKNIVIQNRIDNENRVKKQLEDIKAVNRDKFNIEQLPNEPLNDYLTRMQTLQNERLDMTLYDEKAKIEQIRTFKENLKLLIRSDVIIENVVKSFNDNEIYDINKNFILIRDAYINTYGYDNKNITDIDIINFIRDTLNNLSTFEINKEDPALIGSIGLTVLNDAVGTPTKYSFDTVDNAFYVINTDTNKYIYLKIGSIKNKKYVFYSKTTNESGHFNQVLERVSPDKNKDDRWFNIYNDYLQLDAYAFNELFNNHSKVSDLYDFLKARYTLTPVSEIKQSQVGYRNISRGYGIGIKNINDIPKYIDFGNVILLLNQLYFKNKLSIKYKCLSEIKGFKSVKVSDNFVDLIMNIINNKDYTDKIKLLKTDENELFNLLLYKSGLHKIVPNEKEDVKQKLKEKFLIIEGEIIAGNNHPSVLKDLEDTLWKLSHLGAFSKKVAEAYLKQFK